MSSSSRITINEKFNCQKFGGEINFIVKEVSLPLSGTGIPATIAHAPKCNGWPRCGVFPAGFPQEVGNISISSVTGCPFFDNRKNSGQ